MGVAVTGYPGGIGIPSEERTAIVFNRTGSTLTLWELVQLDHTDADANYTDPNENTPVAVGLGSANNFLGNVITPTAASATVPGIGGQVNATTVGTAPAIFGVVVDLLDGATAGTTPGANDARVKIMLCGITKIRPPSGSTLTMGRAIYPAATVRTVTNVLAKGVKCLGFALATSGANDLPTTCLFDGWHGFGIAYVDELT